MVEYDFAILIALLITISIVFFSWIYFLIYTLKTLIQVPKLEASKRSQEFVSPRVSIIVPARNEEKYIGKCIESLIRQDYSNYEIIAVNDSSSDSTGKIIQDYSYRNSKVVYVDAEQKPDGWTGKNWACYQGYLIATGDLFLFTDADTIHSLTSLSLAVKYFLSEDLDALTAIPKLVAYDFWTKITLPIFWTLSVVKYSALKANNPKSKVGYFFGCFFIISRKAYETNGTHREVREEIVEDGALGRKVKELGFKLKVVDAKEHIHAVWARDPVTLRHGLERLIASIYKREKITVYLMVIGTFLLLLLPLVVLPFSIVLFLEYSYIYYNMTDLNLLLLALIIGSILLLIITSILQLKYLLLEKIYYAFGFPLACTFIVVALFTAISKSISKNKVNWKDRTYSIR